MLFRSTSFGLRQHPSFPNNETSTVTRLLPHFYGGRPPSRFQLSSCDSRTPTTSGLLRTSTTSGLPRTPAASSLLQTLTANGLPRIPTVSVGAKIRLHWRSWSRRGRGRLRDLQKKSRPEVGLLRQDPLMLKSVLYLNKNGVLERKF